MRLRIGNVELENNLILAPMAGATTCHSASFAGSRAVAFW